MYNYSHSYRNQRKQLEINITYTVARFKCVNFYTCNDA